MATIKAVVGNARADGFLPHKNCSPPLPELYAPRHCDGVMPVSDLKNRIKCCWYTNPRSVLTCVMESDSD